MELKHPDDKTYSKNPKQLWYTLKKNFQMFVIMNIVIK